MQLKISHTTRYDYEKPVHYVLQQVRMTPRDTPQQRVRDWALTVTGGIREVSYSDHHANLTDLISVPSGTRQVEITASGTVETLDNSGIFGKQPTSVPVWYFQRGTELTRAGDGIAALAAGIEGVSDRLEALHDLSDRIAAAVAYGAGETYTMTTAEDALAGGTGVCQDHAHIFISAARSAGVPARYVSGYLQMDGRVDQDAGHAWAEAYLDTLGWVGFDVSNRQSPDERYVRIACGRDYADAAPLSGLRQGFGDESMIVSLQVQQ